jgi:hypothetical protein
VYVRRTSRTAPWRLVAALRRDPAGGEWRAEYGDRNDIDGVPRTIRLTSSDRTRFDLQLALSQVAINEPLGADVFRVQVPRSADPMTLDELRRGGPLRVSPAGSRDAR